MPLLSGTAAVVTTCRPTKSALKSFETRTLVTDVPIQPCDGCPRFVHVVQCVTSPSLRSSLSILDGYNVGFPRPHNLHQDNYLSVACRCRNLQLVNSSSQSFTVGFCLLSPRSRLCTSTRQLVNAHMWQAKRFKSSKVLRTPSSKRRTLGILDFDSVCLSTPHTRHSMLGGLASFTPRGAILPVRCQWLATHGNLLSVTWYPIPRSTMLCKEIQTSSKVTIIQMPRLPSSAPLRIAHCAADWDGPAILFHDKRSPSDSARWENKMTEYFYTD